MIGFCSFQYFVKVPTCWKQSINHSAWFLAFTLLSKSMKQACGNEVVCLAFVRKIWYPRCEVKLALKSNPGCCECGGIKTDTQIFPKNTVFTTLRINSWLEDSCVGLWKFQWILWGTKITVKGAWMKGNQCKTYCMLSVKYTKLVVKGQPMLN